MQTLNFRLAIKNQTHAFTFSLKAILNVTSISITDFGSAYDTIQKFDFHIRSASIILPDGLTFIRSPNLIGL